MHVAKQSLVNTSIPSLSNLPRRIKIMSCLIDLQERKCREFYLIREGSICFTKFSEHLDFPSCICMLYSKPISLFPETYQEVHSWYDLLLKLCCRTLGLRNLVYKCRTLVFDHLQFFKYFILLILHFLYFLLWRRQLFFNFFSSSYFRSTPAFECFILSKMQVETSFRRKTGITLVHQ